MYRKMELINITEIFIFISKILLFNHKTLLMAKLKINISFERTLMPFLMFQTERLMRLLNNELKYVIFSVLIFGRTYSISFMNI